MHACDRPNILAIGAFERDNFGDYLFYLLLSRILAGMRLGASGILFSDQRPMLGVLVMPYAHLLMQRKWDAVVVVGGEIGAVSQEMALRMSLPPGEAKMFGDLQDQSETTRFLTCLEPWEPAYLPDMTRYPLNAETPFLINSAGLSRLAEIPKESHFYLESVKRLRGAQSIGVRERSSSNFLAQEGIESELQPDIVHAVRRFFSADIEALRTTINGRYVLVQISAQMIDQAGLQVIVAALRSVAEDLRVDIVFFAAGTANYHDDFSRYDELRNQLLAEGYSGNCRILRVRDPLYLVAAVANAKLWVGSSLHGRIVAIEYGVPRISLVNAKVAQYALLWDKEYPFNVGFEALPDQARQVMRMGSQPVSDEGSGLGRYVESAFLSVLAEVLPA